MKLINRFIFTVTAISLFLSTLTNAAKITGELKKWHKVTLIFDGPQTSETATPNPFTDYRLEVTFNHNSGTSYTVPGYYAADGNAGQTGADSGNKWRVHFAPDKTGTWKWKASFRKGDNITVSDGPAAGESAGYMDGIAGTFSIADSDKTAPDFRSKGRLQYVNKHYLQFAESKEYFLKCGPDAPETFLAYRDFDGTEAFNDDAPLKSWQPHVIDWKPGDPTWKSGRGKGMIGAINYLSSKGVNAVSFLTYNAGGDGDNVWPFRERDEKFRYDCSKLDQWQIVFDHAQAKGLYLHFKMQETENDDNQQEAEDDDNQKADPNRVPESLDGGDLGPERKLYCRQLIARFGYALALNWNLGEENTQTPRQQRAMAAYIKKHDPYNHLIVVHTYPDQQDEVYSQLLGEQSELTGASLQNDWNDTHSRTLHWVKASAKAGKPWVVANDEQGPAELGVAPDTGYKGYNPSEAGYDMHDIRKSVLWGNLMAGGAGVEYYFGYDAPENDLECEDYRSRDKSWDYGRFALEFFKKQNIPFWEMESRDELTRNNNDYCFVKEGQLYLIYQKKGGPLNLDLSVGRFKYGYFNPRTGDGADSLLYTNQVEGSARHTFTAPDNQDWLLIIRSSNGGEVTQSEKSPDEDTNTSKGGR